MMEQFMAVGMCLCVWAHADVAAWVEMMTAGESFGPKSGSAFSLARPPAGIGRRGQVALCGWRFQSLVSIGTSRCKHAVE